MSSSSSSKEASTASDFVKQSVHDAPTNKHGEIQVSSDEILVLVAHKEVRRWDAKLRRALQRGLERRAGKGNIRLPQVRTVDTWDDVNTELDNAKPKQRVVQIFTHGQRGDPRPLAKDPAKLWVDNKTNEFADGKKFASTLEGYDCALVTACHSYNMLETMLEEDKQKIKHLIVCEGKLKDEEALEVAVSFYCALLHDKLTIESAARVAAEALDKKIANDERHVKLHYYQNGVEKPIDKIGLEKAIPLSSWRLTQFFVAFILLLAGGLWLAYKNTDTHPTDNALEKPPVRLIEEPGVWVDRPELSDLKKLVVEDGNIALNLVLHSDDGIPGGQGKTTLARKLAFDLRDSFGGHHIELDMKAGLVDMAGVVTKQTTVLRACDIPIDEKMLPEDIRLAYRALFSKVHDGVLLFDDVQKDDDKLLVDELLPPKESGWLVIVTTRRGDLMSLKPIAEEYGVGRLSTEAGIELLKKHAYGKNSKRPALVDGDEKVLEEIVEACGHIALAIELAGSRLNKKPSLKLTRLHEQLIEKGAHKLDAMKASLHVSYDDLSNDLKRAFWQAASFPSSFPLVVFENAMNRIEKDNSKDENNDDDGFSDDEDEAASSLDSLVSLSLVQRLSDDRFIVHDVVREFARKQADKEQLAKCDEFAGFAYADLMFEIEMKFKQFGESKQAIDRMRVEFNALEHFMKFGSFDVRTFIALSSDAFFHFVLPNSAQFTFLKKLHNEMSNKSEFVQSYQAMVESGFLEVQDKLAGSHSAKGDYYQALKMHPVAFYARLNVLGIDHIDTLKSKHNVAAALRDIGLLNDSIKLFNETLLDQEKVLGTEHQDTLTCKHNLALALKKNDQFKEAKKLLQELIPVEKRVFGAEHPKTIASKNNLASVLGNLGLFDDAINILKEDVIPWLDSNYGPDHERTIRSKKDLVDTEQLRIKAKMRANDNIKQ